MVSPKHGGAQLEQTALKLTQVYVCSYGNEYLLGTRQLQCSAAYVLKRDSANDITITQMFITLAIMLEVY